MLVKATTRPSLLMEGVEALPSEGFPASSWLTSVVDGTQVAGCPMQVSRRNSSWVELGTPGLGIRSPTWARKTTKRPSPLMAFWGGMLLFTTAPLGSCLPEASTETRRIEGVQPAGALAP